GIVGGFAPLGKMARDGLIEIEGKDRVATFVAAVADDVFPFFLVGIFLSLGPRRASGKVKAARVGRPGKGVHVFVALREGKGLTTRGENQVDLCRLALGVFSGAS